MMIFCVIGKVFMFHSFMFESTSGPNGTFNPVEKVRFVYTK